MKRECGTCTECCTALGVHELDKRAFTHCVHERQGCVVYASRPESCRTFQCLWLHGHFDRKDRPDRIGIVFSTAEFADLTQVVMAHVRKPGADKEGRGQELIQILAQHLPVCIVRSDGTRSIALPESFEHLIGRIRDELNAVAVVEDGKLRRLPVVQ